MREILFRGKSKENGEWVEGGTLIQDSGMVFITNENNIEYPEWIDKDTFGQYTGLTDKNGKKIFEGDIITYCGRLKCVIKYANDVAGFEMRETTRQDTFVDDTIYKELLWDSEVIGNKWDNPELLK